MSWYNFLSGELAADYNQEHVNRELINVETAFKLHSISTKTNVYKFHFFINAKDIKTFRGIIDQNFKFSKFLSCNSLLINNEKDVEQQPYIYYSPETYILGTSLDGVQYSFTIFTLNIKTKEVLASKFNEAIKMEEALK